MTSSLLAFGFPLHTHKFQSRYYRGRNHQFQARRCGRQVADLFHGVQTTVCLQSSTGCTRIVSFQDLTRRQCILMCFVASREFHQIFNPCSANIFGEPSDFLYWPMDFASARNTGRNNFWCCRVSSRRQGLAQNTRSSVRLDFRPSLDFSHLAIYDRV